MPDTQSCKSFRTAGEQALPAAHGPSHVGEWRRERQSAGSGGGGGGRGRSSLGTEIGCFCSPLPLARSPQNTSAMSTTTTAPTIDAGDAFSRVGGRGALSEKV